MKKLIIAVVLFSIIACAEQAEEKAGDDIDLGVLRNIFEVQTTWNDVNTRSKILSTKGAYTVNGVASGIVGGKVTLTTTTHGQYVCVEGSVTCWSVFE